MLIRDIMTPNIIAAMRMTPIRKAVEVMLSNHVRHIPIVEDHRVIGMISDRDIRIMPQLQHYFDVPQEEIDAFLEQPLDVVLKTRFTIEGDVIMVSQYDSVASAVDVMLANKLSALPVVESEDSPELIGIVSYVDILKAARPLLG